MSKVTIERTQKIYFKMIYVYELKVKLLLSIQHLFHYCKTQSKKSLS